MNYYKLISGTNFVGVATQHNFREFQHRHSIILACDEERAQYVQCGDVFYRADWMVPVTTDKVSYETVELVRIEKEEYDILLAAVEKGEEIEIEQEQNEPVEEVPVIDPLEEVTLDYLKTAKTAEMSAACNKTITNGFDVMLSDGNTYHFSLTTQDQLNLITLSSMIANGETQIPYHADDELCRFYSADDINIIIAAATQFKTYQVSYFNALKMYISSLKRKKTVAAVYYGMAIPEEYQSEVLKIMLASANGGEE